MSAKIFPAEKLEELFKMEAEAVNIAFGANSETGLLMLGNSITSFENLLTMLKGSFIRGMDLDYRIFIVGLLENIDDKYKPEAMSQIIFPREINQKTNRN